jgi:aspartyl-tRNA(Asn)/glutamyl-tRNA(Gln) amidotransferase subunit C
MRMPKEDVLAVANLARIGVAEDEIERIGDELGAVLGYVERLQSVDTTGVPEASALPIEAAGFRADEVNAASDLERELILGNFPASEGGFLKAPAVFEKPKR